MMVENLLTASSYSIGSSQFSTVTWLLCCRMLIQCFDYRVPMSPHTVYHCVALKTPSLHGMPLGDHFTNLSCYQRQRMGSWQGLWAYTFPRNSTSNYPSDRNFQNLSSQRLIYMPRLLYRMPFPMTGISLDRLYPKAIE